MPRKKPYTTEMSERPGKMTGKGFYRDATQMTKPLDPVTDEIDAFKDSVARRSAKRHKKRRAK